ncbi:MAG: aldo/keto reductase [Proteobacteria bacterium]|nr:aldo/keto reductase [Pseudomonadota bacterium]
MKYVERLGTTAPALGFGTFPMMGDDCYSAVLWALEVGYRHIDTAQLYGNEADVGRALADSSVPRGEIFLTTKCGVYDASPVAVAAELTDSLVKLQTDYVDLWMYHWHNRDTPLGETLAALAEAKAAGLARQIGVGNFTIPLIREAVDVHGAVLFTNQFENHPLLRQPHVERATWAHGMAVTAHSPLGRGKVPGNGVLEGIGAKYGKSAVQVAIRWQLDKPNTLLVPKSTRRAGIVENFDVFDFTLDDDDRAAIDGLPNGQRGSDPPFAPDWDPI